MVFDAGPAFGTILTLITLFMIMPVVSYILSRAASPRFHVEPAQLEEIRKLAGELDLAVERALEDATHSFASAASERRALDKLLELADRVERFRLQMQFDRIRKTGLLQQEFFLLQTAFEKARPGFAELGAFHKSAVSFHELIQVMDALRFHFEVPSQPEEDQVNKFTSDGAFQKKRQA